MLRQLGIEEEKIDGLDFEEEAKAPKLGYQVVGCS
jgi:hypothetical protein